MKHYEIDKIVLVTSLLSVLSNQRSTVSHYKPLWVILTNTTSRKFVQTGPFITPLIPLLKCHCEGLCFTYFGKNNKSYVVHYSRNSGLDMIGKRISKVQHLLLFSLKKTTLRAAYHLGSNCWTTDKCRQENKCVMQ